MASRQLLIPRIAAVGTSFSPLPGHGYWVTSAHRVEVEVGADEHASATPLQGRRRCAAGGRPTDISTSPQAAAEGDDADQPPDTRPRNN
jgi:hypothetical protein